MNEQKKQYPEIGKLYHPEVRRWEERNEYNFRDGGHELRLHYRHPSWQEIHAVQSGPCEFALVYEQGVLFLLFHFPPVIPWGDCPYSWHAVPEEQRTEPLLPGPGQTLLVVLYVVLINANTGIVEALRPVLLPPAFGTALHTSIHAQMALPDDPERFSASVREIYQQYRTPQALSVRALAHCNIPAQA